MSETKIFGAEKTNLTRASPSDSTARFCFECWFFPAQKPTLAPATMIPGAKFHGGQAVPFRMAHLVSHTCELLFNKVGGVPCATHLAACRKHKRTHRTGPWRTRSE